MAALCDHDLGDALMHLHRYREAEQTLRKALATFIALGGDDYPDANATRSTLGATLVQRARGAEGLQLLQQALASLERTQGPNIIAWTVPARNRAAAAALDRGALDLAQGWLERQPQSVSLAAPEDVAQQPLTLLLDARLQLARGQVALAQTAFDRARLGWPESTAKHTPHRAVLLLVQAQLDLAQGRHEAGLRLLDEIRAEWSGQGEDLSEPAVVASLLLAQAWLDQGSAAPAAALMRSLLDRVLDDPDHDDLSDWEARTRRLLGDALLALGQVDAARPHLERAVALRQGFDDPASPWLAQARASLARSQSGLHRRPQAGATVNPRKT
jgi:tetratricopeptide (TPR) repeat protein